MTSLHAGKRVLVTGGAGFIGSHIIEELLRTDVKKIYCLDNYAAGTASNLPFTAIDPRLEKIYGDVRDLDVVRELALESDFIYHMAASKLVVSMERPRVDLETNIIGTFNILQAMREKKGIRLLHGSTGSVLGSSNRPMREENPTSPTTPYGISKLSAEKYCTFFAKEFGLDVRVIRFFHVYGPRQDYNGKAGVINIFLGRILRNLPPVIHGTGEQVRCFTYVKDDVRAAFFLMGRDDTSGEIYHVASSVRISIKDLANLLIERYGHEGMKPDWGPARPGENMFPVPDTSKIESLGFHVHTPFEEGLDQTKKWIADDLQVSGELP